MMVIQIHPEAAKRFDQLANELLSKVAPEPPLASAANQFRPDIHPVAHIPPEDIIGEVQETKSIVDGTGEEVGRFFEHTNPPVGLVGFAFKALTEFAVRIGEIEGLRHTTSVGFIRDLVFKWLEGTYKNQIT